MSAKRPKRFLKIKECDRCHVTKPAAEFPGVRGGGTTDICKVCKSEAVSEAMREFHARERESVEARNKQHFDEQLRKDQERWDSLPDGHPYKAPRRPGSEV